MSYRQVAGEHQEHDEQQRQDPTRPTREGHRRLVVLDPRPTKDVGRADARVPSRAATTMAPRCCSRRGLPCPSRQGTGRTSPTAWRGSRRSPGRAAGPSNPRASPAPPRARGRGGCRVQLLPVRPLAVRAYRVGHARPAGRAGLRGGARRGPRDVRQGGGGLCPRRGRGHHRTSRPPSPRSFGFRLSSFVDRAPRPAREQVVPRAPRGAIGQPRCGVHGGYSRRRRFSPLLGPQT